MRGAGISIGATSIAAASREVDQVRRACVRFAGLQVMSERVAATRKIEIRVWHVCDYE